MTLREPQGGATVDPAAPTPGPAGLGLSSPGAADRSRSIAKRRAWKTPIVFAVFAALGVLLFVVFGVDADANFLLSPVGDAVQIPGYTITVTVMDGRRIARLRVTPRPEPAPEPDASEDTAPNPALPGAAHVASGWRATSRQATKLCAYSRETSWSKGDTCPVLVGLTPFWSLTSGRSTPSSSPAGYVSATSTRRSCRPRCR